MYLFFASAQSTPLIDIKGTWITNVASDAMLNQEKVKASVAHCKRNGLTDIFVVVWNDGLTMYPSKAVKNILELLKTLFIRILILLKHM